MNNYLVTGGAGFAGSNLAILLKQRHSSHRIIFLDNLKRRGSELNLRRLRKNEIEFVHGDIRNREDLCFNCDISVVIECSAEPSVLAGFNESPEYLLYTNLVGTINCLELARIQKADFIFVSTSRIYPFGRLNALNVQEGETRFIPGEEQDIPGASKAGIAENFPIDGPRSLYGATKLVSELFVQEYNEIYGLRTIIDLET